MTKIINVNLRSLEGIARAEKEKARLENLGYTLVDTSSGLDSATLLYKKERG